MRIFLSIFLSFCLLISTNSQASKQFAQALEQKNWNKAKKDKDHDLKTLAIWLKLITESNSDFYELTNFIAKNPHWPKQELLKRKIEENNFNNCKNQDILAWFKANPPQSSIGRKKYLSLIEDPILKSHYIKLIWEESLFTKAEEKEFINAHKNLITQADYINRLNHLLFNHHTDQAIRLLPLISEKLRPLYQTRISLQQGKAEGLLAYQKLDKNLQQDIGILHNLAHMYEKQKNEEKLIETLKQASNLGGKYQFYFWNIKAKLIRNLIQEKSYKTAYLFSSSHGHLNIKEYSEAEWLAGWIALRFLNNPELAITHFTNVYNKVKLPISLARGSYWLGRAYEKLNNAEQSKNWYQISAKYYLGFYSQLSICKINDCNINLPNEPLTDKKSLQLFDHNALVKAALILEMTKYNYLVQELLFKAIDNSNDPGEIALITKIGFQLEKHHLSVETAKQASYKSVHIINSNYPILNSIYKDHQVDQALIMALIRQESVFNHKAISSAGAMGLMQIMPHVAKETASNIKTKYHKAKLITDPHFNTMLGINHLDKLLKHYNDSYILTIAAYNAGDKAAKQWIEDNGDPRLMKNTDDIIDWMEKITFHETRNYVQRVLEGKSIYNILINKQKRLSILADLKN